MDQQPPPEPEPAEPAAAAPPPPAAEPPAAPPPAAAAPPAAPPPAIPQAWSTTDRASAPPAWVSDPNPVGPAPGVEFAGYGPRLVAYIIDGFLLGIVITILSVVLVGVLVATTNDGEVGAAGAATIAIWTGVIIILSVIYFPYFWQRSGRTPGMQVFGIKVVRDVDGGPIGWGSAILRYIGFLIDSIVFGLPIGFLWVFFDKRRRAWHDLIGGTVVIKG